MNSSKIKQNKKSRTNLFDGTDFTSLVRDSSLASKLIEVKNPDNLSKITIIGNGWGHSTTISSKYDLKLIHPQHIIQSKNLDNILKTNNKIKIKYNRFDEEDYDYDYDDQDSTSLDYNNYIDYRAINCLDKNSYTSVNTIMNNNSNPSLVIKSDLSQD